MNQLTTQTNSTSLTIPSKNAFETYSESVSGNRIVGDLLRFAKGDWLSGKDKMDVPVGTRLIAAVEETVIGWIRWDEGKIADLRMGRIAEGFMPPSRRELGFEEQNEWPVDDDNNPQDPWQLTSYLILKGENDDQLYTYTPSSAGGRNAVAKLCGEYGKRSRHKPNEFPIVALKVDSYEHKEKRRGRIKVPVLQVVGWVGKATTLAAIAGEAADAAADEMASADTDVEEDIVAEPVNAKAGRSRKAPAAESTRF